nr:MAG TPA: Scaffold protein [Microviridae sp.]
MAKQRITWRDQYDDTRDAQERALTDSHPIGESLTIQSDAIDTDINVIVARFKGGEGIMPPPLDQTDFYDTTGLPDLREILDIQRDALAHFNALPAKLRNRFRNSPAELWDFVQDANNIEEAIALGILTKRDPEPSSEAALPVKAAETPKVTETQSPK